MRVHLTPASISESCLRRAACHDDLAGADGFDDVELAEQTDGGVDLVGVSGDQGDEGVFLKVHGLAVVVLDDLEDLGALRGSGGDPTLLLVLAGIALGALVGAVISLLKVLADPYNQLPAITFCLPE